MKSLLIATTALVSVFSLAPAAALPARQAAPDHYPPDSNRDFLCDYGFTIKTTAFVSSSYLYDYWLRAAKSVVGKGKKVTQVIVANAPQAFSAPSGYSVAIYSSRKKMPFEQLANTVTRQPQQCGRVNLQISPTMLTKGKKYWIVETAREPVLHSGVTSATNKVRWLYEQKHTSRALWQSGSCISGSCYSRTKWQSITGGVPYAWVK